MCFSLGQLIYKKTILPCPLPFFYQHDSNMSANGSDVLGMFTLQNASVLAYISETAVNGPHLDPQAHVHDSTVQFTAHPEGAEEMCTPKYFVFNSQVTIHVTFAYMSNVKLVECLVLMCQIFLVLYF